MDGQIFRDRQKRERILCNSCNQYISSCDDGVGRKAGQIAGIAEHDSQYRILPLTDEQHGAYSRQ